MYENRAEGTRQAKIGGKVLKNNCMNIIIVHMDEFLDIPLVFQAIEKRKERIFSM